LIHIECSVYFFFGRVRALASPAPGGRRAPWKIFRLHTWRNQAISFL